MEIEFEKVSCNICNLQDTKPYLLREDLNLYIPGTFQLVQCKNCGLIYENPRPSVNSWGTIYPEEYDQYDGQQNQSGIRKGLRRYGLQKQIRSIEAYLTSGNLLDIGCATGDFIQEASKRSGWTVFGVEPSPKASEIARARGLKCSHRFLGGRSVSGY